MNTILWDSKKMQYHTSLGVIFDALEGRQNELNWLITDYECNYYPKLLERRPERIWISGENLTILVEHEQHLQFIWGVLSAFPKSVVLDIDNLSIEPDIIMNNDLWEVPKVRHPLAIAEIVCWDSSATMLLSKDDDLTRRFRNYFPEAEDFEEYIAKKY